MKKEFIILFLFLFTILPVCFGMGTVKIVYSSNSTGNYEIYIMNRDGTSLTQLTDDPASDREPALSPDGRWVAFASNRSGIYQIYYISADSSEVLGGVAHQLTNGFSDARNPDWSPKNWALDTYISVCYERDEAIYFKDILSGASEHMVAGSDNNSRPVWTVDGHHILFVHSDWSDECGHYITNLKGRGTLCGNIFPVTAVSPCDSNVTSAALPFQEGFGIILMNARYSPNRRQIIKNDGTPIVSWIAPMNDFAFYPAGDSIIFAAYDAFSDYELFKKSSSSGGISQRVTNNSSHEPDVDCGVRLPDYRIVNIFPLCVRGNESFGVYTDPSLVTPISFSFFGNGYIDSSLVFTFDGIPFYYGDIALTYDAARQDVHFSLLDGGIYPEVYRHYDITAHILAFDGVDTVSVDSSWSYAYNPAPSAMDSSFAALDRYLSGQMSTIATVNRIRRFLRFGSYDRFANLIYIAPLSRYFFSDTDYVVGTIRYGTWSDPYIGDIYGRIDGVPLTIRTAIFENIDTSITHSLDAIFRHISDHLASQPDSYYYQVPSWERIDTSLAEYPPTDDSLAVKLHLLSGKFTFYGELVRTLDATIKRYRKAVMKEDFQYVGLQGKGIMRLSEKLFDICNILYTDCSEISADIRGTDDDRRLNVSYIDSLQARLGLLGASSIELKRLIAAGFTTEQVNELIDSVSAIPTESLYTCYLSDIFDSLAMSFAWGLSRYQGVVNAASDMLDSLIGAGIVADTLPYADAGGPYTATEGDSVELDASSSAPFFKTGIVAFWWDYNADGVFDDDSGEVVYFHPPCEGFYPIGLKILNSPGYYAYDYTYVIGKTSNLEPVLYDFTPESLFFIAPADSEIYFYTSAYDPEGEAAPPYFVWIRDGREEPTHERAFSHTFVPADTGLHRIVLCISDSNSASFERYNDWWFHIGDVTLPARENLSRPESFSLITAYPNPFNSICKISIVVPRWALQASISIYDIRGHLLMKRASIDKGEISIDWDAMGKPSGVYLVRVDIDGETIVRRIVSIR